MRGRRALPALALGAALAAAAPAAARRQAVSEWELPVRVSGVVSVDFHGDRAAGCEQVAMCDVSGNETWDPPSQAELDALVTTKPRAGFLYFDSGPTEEGGKTTARVRRIARDGSVHTCADADTGREGGSQLGPVAGGLEVRLLSAGPDAFGGGSLLGTRCAGPVDADIRGPLPAGRLTAAQLKKGRTIVDLTGERTFASHGLAGTVHSSVILALGRSARQRESKPSRRFRVRRVKVLTVRYAIESANGRAALSFGGLPEPELCEALDACGLGGSVTLSTAATGGSVQLVAFGSGRLSRRQLLARVGLVRTPRGSKLRGEGSGFWNGGGTVSAELNRSGVLACRDSGPLPGGTLVLAERGRRLLVTYSPGVDTGLDALRTRCPGPAGADVGGEGVLARGEAPVGILRRPRFALHLGRGTSFSGQGYRGTASADLTVVLRRRKIAVRSFGVPAPLDGGNSLGVVDELIASRARRLP